MKICSIYGNRKRESNVLSIMAINENENVVISMAENVKESMKTNQSMY